LKIVNIILLALPDFHLYCKEVVVVSLKFPQGSKLVKKCLVHLTKISERIPWERIELVVGDRLEAGWECLIEEEVIVGVNRHLILVLAEMKEWVESSRIVIKRQYHKLLWEAERGNLS